MAVVHIILVGNGHKLATGLGNGKIPVLLDVASALPHIQRDLVFLHQLHQIWAWCRGGADDLRRYRLRL